ncbi:roadblock/LC7 domain-containing protein [Streptomyces sp. NRRL B-24484]|uniref:roadblock/LC7 domain-containing protein n=1 Tax=Streptomyces sp. NRRL B-24484 TaxID=1463833 RepID=UPI0004BE4ECD|nr:roadblock/LC7 domain-containing protein [Streptomyces sp. NRRL B-24484]
MTLSASRPAIEDPSWVLNPITEVSNEVKHALILSSDGMVIGATEGLLREAAEGISAMTAALHGAARAAANAALDASDGTPITTITVQNTHGTYMIMPAGARTNTFIAVAGGLDMPMGTVAHIMARQAKKLGEQLMSVPARTREAS